MFEDETESDKVKEKILAKCKQYLERAEKIAEYLNRFDLCSSPMWNKHALSSDKKKRPTPAASLAGSTGKLAGATTSSPDSAGSDLEISRSTPASGVKGALGRVYQSIANHNKLAATVSQS